MPRGREWAPERRDELIARWNAGETRSHIRRAMHLTTGQMAGRVTKYNLHSPPSRRQNRNPDNSAVLEGRTRFRAQVTRDGMALKPGDSSQKLGKVITKGDWKGFPVWSLTLEERKTCPTSCAAYRFCYGDNMPWAKRMVWDDELQRKLWGELRTLQRRSPHGFAVRLHALGDFPNAGAVDFWHEALCHFPALHVFGYSAWPHHTKIGRAVKNLRDMQWDRFAVRTSGALTGPRTVVIERAEDNPEGAIICPAQTGGTRSCSSCGLCWSPAAREKTIAFLRH